MLQLEHDGVVGRAGVDWDAAQALHDAAGPAEVAKTKSLSSEPSGVAIGHAPGLELGTDTCCAALWAREDKAKPPEGAVGHWASAMRCCDEDEAVHVGFWPEDQGSVQQGLGFGGEQRGRVGDV